MEFKGKLSEAVPSKDAIAICWVCELVYDDDTFIAGPIKCPGGCGGVLEKRDSIHQAITLLEGLTESGWSEGDVATVQRQLNQLIQIRECGGYADAS